jgi:hypothetical protein
MIGINKTESSFFELGQIYSEIHDWIDSKKATEDIEGLLKEVKSEVSQLEQEMKLVESDYSFNSLYKDNKFKNAFDWGNISRWSKRYDRVDYEYSHKDLERIDLTSIMRNFSGNSLPIELAILFRKLNQLRFVWDIKEKKIVMAEVGDTLPETVTEVGIVFGTFNYTEKGCTVKATKNLLDFLFGDEDESQKGLSSTASLILKNLQKDFENISEEVKRGVSTGNLSRLTRIVDFKLKLRGWVDSKFPQVIHIPFYLKTNFASIQKIENNLSIKFGSYKNEEVKKIQEGDKVFSDEEFINYTNLPKEKAADKEFYFTAQLIKRLTSPLVDTDKNYRSELVADVKTYLYSNFGDLKEKYLSVFLSKLYLTEILAEEDCIAITQKLLDRSQFFDLVPSESEKINSSVGVDSGYLDNILFKSQKIHLGSFQYYTYDLLNCLKQFKDKLTFSNRVRLNLKPEKDYIRLQTFVLKNYSGINLDLMKESFDLLNQFFTENQYPVLIGEVTVDVQEFLKANSSEILYLTRFIKNFDIKRIRLVNINSNSETENVTKKLEDILGDVSVTKVDDSINHRIQLSDFFGYSITNGFKEEFEFCRDLIEFTKTLIEIKNN